MEFREHWAGIFAAHPWLDGPKDSYLGFSKRGGGASGEHSHAINLWQHFARGVGAGEVVEVSAAMAYVREGGLDYDKLCLLNLRTESGLVGRVVQDVVTLPPRKWARIQGRNCWLPADAPWVADFIEELKHVEAVLDHADKAEVIRLDQGLDTMLVVAAAHRSAREGRSIRIDRSAGCTPEALASV